MSRKKGRTGIPVGRSTPALAKRRPSVLPKAFVALCFIALSIGAISYLKNKPAKNLEVPATSVPARPTTEDQVRTEPVTEAHSQLAGPETLSAELSNEEKALALSTQADELADAGKNEEAAEQYRQSIALSPEGEDTHFNLGIVLGRMGKHEEAIAAYSKALEIAPDYAEAHNNLGNVYMKLNKATEALPHFEKALEINPEHAPAHNSLGTALGKLGRHEEALKAFKKSVELSPVFLPARYNLGNALVQTGDPEGAANEFEEVLKIQPEFMPAREALEKIKMPGK